MRSALRGALALFIAGGALSLSNPTASAQDPDSGSLGGYGAASSYATSGTSGGGSMIIPYGGMFEGFMPSRTGGGSSLSFRSRPSAAMGSARTSFSLSPPAGGMGRKPDSRMAPAFGTSLFGAPGGMGRRPAELGGIGVMPPSFGYPFRQPPSLVPSSGVGTAM